METASQAIEACLRAGERRWLTRQRSEEQLALERKSAAQQLARSATRVVADRRSRAEAKAAVYNHLIPILELHYQSQRRLHRTCRRALACMAGALALAIASAIIF